MMSRKLYQGGLNEHDAPLLLRRQDSVLLGELRDKVLSDQLHVVVTGVETEHWHLVAPLVDEPFLGLCQSFDIRRPVLLRNVLSDGFAAPLQCVIEQPEQLVGLSGNNVLGFGVQRVRDGDRNGHVLAFVRKIPRRLACLGLVLVRLEVINNSVWVRFVPLRRAPVIPPGAGKLVLPSFNNCVAVAPEEIGFCST